MSDFGAVWDPAALGNYDATRLPVNLIVDHHTACTFSSAEGRFRTPGAQVSAHFIVDRDGTVYETVLIGDTAYHSGDYTINERSVGIEHVSKIDNAGPDDQFTDVQYQASAQLHIHIAEHFGFPLDTAHVWPHHQVVATACPGVLDIHRLISGGAQPTPAPLATYPLSGTPAPGTTIDVAIPDASIQPGAQWYTNPNGAPIPGVAPAGAVVAVTAAAFDGVNWWDRIGGPGAWWLLDSALDTSSAAHPADSNPTPADYWNDQNKPVTPAPAPAPVHVAIMGGGVASAAAMRQILAGHASSLDLGRIVDAYIHVGLSEGVCDDGAFAQAIHETGYFGFGGDVKASQNNFCGLGATGGGNPGLSFPTIEDGVRAHLRHLRAYATTDALPADTDTVDPRAKYVHRGSAPTFHDLGGKWAPAADYGDRVEALLATLRGIVVSDAPPPAPVPTPVPAPPPAPVPDPGPPAPPAGALAWLLALLNWLVKKFGG